MVLILIWSIFLNKQIILMPTLSQGGVDSTKSSCFNKSYEILQDGRIIEPLVLYSNVGSNA